MAGVLIIAEHLEGRVAPSTPELITAGKRLAAALGSERDARIVVLGSDVRVLANHLAGYTLDVLLADTSQGYDFAPALAGAMDLPLVTNCLAVDFAGDRLVATRRLLNEKVQAQVEIRSERPIVVTMRPGDEKPMGPAAGMMKVTAVPVAIDPSTVRERFVRLERPQVQDIDLSGADIIVSAGRGIQKKENLALIEEFAKAIGGVVGASRPLTDMDWLPKTRQVGQSGKTVRPKLYVACGISGAMQHVAGMKDASLIVAINTDPTAPIFEIAHVGFVADVLKLLPAT